MVVIYVELSEPNETFWFRNPFKGSTISLLSRSFTNDMCNLPVEGMFAVDGKVFLHVPRGNYDASSLKHLVESAGHKVGDAVVSPPIRIMVKGDGSRTITPSKNVIMDEGLVKLLNIENGIKILAKDVAKVIRLRQPPRPYSFIATS
jgi:hypothetical protein